MKKASIAALILALSMIFTGCTVNEVRLYNAFMKSQDITSMESDTKITFTLDGEGFSQEDQQSMQEVAKMLKNSEVNIYQKMIQNEEKTAAKVQMNTDLNFDGMQQMDMKVWVDTDMSGDTPKMVEIIKMPQALMAGISPEDQSKKYIVYDLVDMAASDQEEIDFNELMDFSKEMQPKIMDFMKDYHKNFDPGFKIASFKGTRDVNGKTLSIYEVKLNDESFKELIKYVVNSEIDNEDSIKFLKEYMNAVMSFTQIPNEEKESAKEEINQELDKLQESLPEIKKQFNKFMDDFKDVKVLGEEGIVIEYGVNSDGYIVHEAGKIDLNIDLKAIGEAMSAPVENLGTLKLGIDYNTKIYNINKDMKINMPNVNENNALYFKDMMEQEINTINEEVQEVPEEIQDEPAEEIEQNK